jgi:hypothetical protein
MNELYPLKSLVWKEHLPLKSSVVLVAFTRKETNDFPSGRIIETAIRPSTPEAITLTRFLLKETSFKQNLNFRSCPFNLNFSRIFRNNCTNIQF